MKGSKASLNRYLEASILLSFILAISILLMIPLFINGWKEVPLGVLLGGLFGGLTLLIFSFIEKKENKKQSMKLTITVIIVRFIVICLLLVIVGYLYYQQGWKIFNIFAVAGGYLLSTVCLMIAYLKKKGAENV